MRRTFAILLAIVLPTTLFVTFLVLTPRSDIPSGVQIELDKYLQYQSTTSPYSQAFVVSRMDQIALPWNFTSQMSATSFGDSLYYQTGHRYQNETDESQPALITDTDLEQLVLSSRNNLLPLPFPPLDGWCVLLNTASQEQPRIVYVLLHKDLYTADWVVHEARSNVTDEELRTDLASIGCALDIP